MKYLASAILLVSLSAISHAEEPGHFEVEGVSFKLSFDEAMAEEGEQAAKEQNKRVEDFFAGADLLIHDAQYTHEEYETSKLGWGHSSIEDALKAANRAEVKRLVFFHHDPERTDAQIDELSEKYSTSTYSGDTEVIFAREGMQIDV